MRNGSLLIKLILCLALGLAFLSGISGCAAGEHYSSLSPPPDDLIGMDVWDVRRRLPAYVGGKDTIAAMYTQYFNKAVQSNITFLEHYRITVYTKRDTFQYRVSGRAMWADGVTYELQDDITPFMYEIYNDR